jgi:hypothetical protein
MISSPRFILAAALFASASVSAFAQAPKVDAARATRLATDYLATLGPGAPHIVSVTLEQTALLSGTQSWIIKWSAPVMDGANREIGVRVKMDGSLAHLVDNLEGRKERATRRPMLR